MNLNNSREMPDFSPENLRQMSEEMLAHIVRALDSAGKLDDPRTGVAMTHVIEFTKAGVEQAIKAINLAGQESLNLDNLDLVSEAFDAKPELN